MNGKTIVVLFDGTGNAPDSGHDEGQFPLGDATNVEKLASLLAKDEHQIVDYHAGVATRGHTLIKEADGVFGASVALIIDAAYRTICAQLKPADQLIIFGFSRGAASARILARRIDRDGVNKAPAKIAFMGLWDTVAALGVPHLDLERFRKQYDDADDRLRIPKNVDSVAHLLSIDETRALFTPTLISCDSVDTRVHEAWFIGDHADVGGGWKKEPADETQLSDITLDYMIQIAQTQVPGIRFKSDWKTNLQVSTDGKGTVHRAERFAPARILGGSGPRSLSSYRAGKALINKSVANRFAKDNTYRPGALRNDLSLFEIID